MHFPYVINKLVGGIAHWTFRLLIAFICQKIGIRMARDTERDLAYMLTGLFLVGIGFWTYSYFW